MPRSRKPQTPRQQAEPQAKSEEDLEPTESPAAEAGRKTVSKANAIRAALAEGIAKPEEAVEFIKEHFGLDVGKGHFSASKSQEKNKKSPSKSVGRPKAAPVATAPRESLAPVSKSASSLELDLLDMMESMKPMVDQYGPDKIKRLVDLLG